MARVRVGAQREFLASNFFIQQSRAAEKMQQYEDDLIKDDRHQLERIILQVRHQP